MMIQQCRETKDALIAELKDAGAVIKNGSVKCPFHDDRSPSGGVYQGEDGAWRYKCHAGDCGFCGDVFDVRAKARNRPLTEVLKEANPANRPATLKTYQSIEEIERTITGTLENRFTYTNPETHKPDLIVLRIRENGKKRFLQISPNHNGYIMAAPPKPWPLYKRANLRMAKEVVVAEGELCVEALNEYNFTATTNPGGAGKAAHADYSPLAGKKIYLWPDNDRVGINHMREVKGICERLEPRPAIFWVDPKNLDLPDKGDVVDLVRETRVLSEGQVGPEIKKVLSKAKSCGVAAEVGGLIEDVVNGSRSAVKWPWPGLSRLTQALIPQTTTILCGDPGATKTFLLLQSLAYWYEQGVKVAVFMLEEDRRSHLLRILAQREANGDLCTLQWLKENSEEAKAAYERHKEFLDGFGQRIDDAPIKQQTLDELVVWVRQKAQAGCRIIAIDPLTAAVATDRPWVSDSKFVAAVRAIVRKHNTSLLLITHPKKGRSGFGLDELAGGAAYQRLADNVFWLEYHKEKQAVRIRTDCGTCEADINRTMHLCKVRSGPGQGLQLGFVFDVKSFLSTEQGIIISKK